MFHGIAGYFILFKGIALYFTVLYGAPANYRIVHLVILIIFSLYVKHLKLFVAFSV